MPLDVLWNECKVSSKRIFKKENRKKKKTGRIAVRATSTSSEDYRKPHQRLIKFCFLSFLIPPMEEEEKKKKKETQLANSHQLRN